MYFLIKCEWWLKPRTFKAWRNGTVHSDCFSSCEQIWLFSRQTEQIAASALDFAPEAALVRLADDARPVQLTSFISLRRNLWLSSLVGEIGIGSRDVGKSVERDGVTLRSFLHPENDFPLSRLYSCVNFTSLDEVFNLIFHVGNKRSDGG